MEETTYREKVTALMNPALSFEEKLDNFALGMCGEAAEFADALDNFEPPEVLIKELGDCRWYYTAMCVTLDLETEFGTHAEICKPDDLAASLLIKAGRIADVIKKVVYHKHPIENKMTALVQFLYYFRYYYDSLCRVLEVTDDEVKEANIKKLSERYSNLEFTPEKSINREEYSGQSVVDLKTGKGDYIKG